MTDKEYTVNWDALPREDDIPYIDLDGERYYFPYFNLIPQNVSVESLRDSIEEDGIEYPIIVDDDNQVIDGMTRLYIAHDLGLPADEIPIKSEDVDEEEGWEKAIELNAVRRQLDGPMRRELIQKIVDRKNWRKPSVHVTDLAQMLGVHKSTISRDIDRIYGEEEIQKLKKRKRTLNVSLTGMRNIRRMIEDDKILQNASKGEKDEYRETLRELVSLVEDERSQINDRIDERST